MSAVVLRKLARASDVHWASYRIIRQLEKLRCTAEERNADSSPGWRDLGIYCGGKVQVISADNPAVNYDKDYSVPHMIFLRGVNRRQDDKIMTVDDVYVYLFEQAILELNRKYSNNSGIDKEDVILTE